MKDTPLTDRLQGDLDREEMRRLSAIDKADLFELLRHPWGRRLYYRLAFRVGLLAAPSFHPAVKDGVCAARHDAYVEGLRSFAHTLQEEAVELDGGELWSLLITEHFASGRDRELRKEMHRDFTRTEDNS